MSAEKLKVHQKIFSLIERMISETVVRDLEFVPKAESRGMSCKIPCPIKDPGSIGKVKVTPADLRLTSSINGLVDQLRVIARSLSFDFLNISGRSCNISEIQAVSVQSPDFRWRTRVFDLFKQFKISKHLNYTALTRHIKIKITPLIYRFRLHISSGIIENNLIVQRLSIRRFPLKSSTNAEKNQLQYWKKLLIETKQHPKDFQLVGIYSLIPFSILDSIKIDFSSRALRYKIACGTKKKIQYSDLAIFQEIENQKPILIKL